MTRWKITIEYDGGPFVGWQRQDNGSSVQQSIEEAAEALCGVATVVAGAGRTDAGVHALGQVAHLDIDKPLRFDQVRDGLNFHLKKHPISVLSAEEMAPDFHARFSAIGRAYRYCILNRRSPPAIEAGKIWHVIRSLDADAMHDAAQCLVGKHDFTSFRTAFCQADSPVKTLDRLDVRRLGDTIEIEVEARSFLHNQVRILVGTLGLVGQGKWTRHDVERALAAADRTAAGPTAPPTGLYLTRVVYP